jgi:catechol-2,3-dioxygenase
MLKSIRHLDYVVLLCNDLLLLKNFYNKIMGFPIYLETDFWIEMRVGSVLLTLSQRGRPFEGPFLPDNSASVHRKFWKYWKHRSLFFKDPEGNILEIYADIEISE